MYAGVPGGSALKLSRKLRSGRVKRGLDRQTRHTVRRPPRKAVRKNGESEKAVVKPNGCSKIGAIRHERLGGQYPPPLKASDLGTLARSCKNACKRWARNEVRAGMKLGEANRRGLPGAHRRVSVTRPDGNTQRRDDAAIVARSLPCTPANSDRDGAPYIGCCKVSAADGLPQFIVSHSYLGAQGPEHRHWGI